MANPFRKLPAHSPVTAFSITAWNRMIDMLNWWQAQTPAFGGQAKRVVDWDQTVFRVRNDTGADLASYAVVGLGGPIFDPAAGGEPELLSQTSMKGVLPDAEDHAGGRWGVYTEATPNGSIGRCCLAGVVPLRVYVTAATDKFCDVIAAETVGGETTYIGTGATGNQILWMAAGVTPETITWAIVRLSAGAPPGCRWYLGTTTAAVTAGTNFTVSALEAVDGGSLPDPDDAGPDTWDVENGLDVGAYYNIDADVVIRIQGFADGRLVPLDPRCPE